MYADIHFANASKSVIHTHTTAGAGEAVSGIVDFDKGAYVWIIGNDTWFSVDQTEALVETSTIAKIPAGIPMRYKLPLESNTIWINAASGGSVSLIQAAS